MIIAVAHNEFTKMKMDDIEQLYGNEKRVLLDIKGLLNREEYEKAGYSYWRL